MRLGTKSRKASSIGDEISIVTTEYHKPSLYVSYTLLSLTQQHLNEDTMSNDQAAEILVELNENKVEYEVPINQVEKFKMD